MILNLNMYILGEANKDMRFFEQSPRISRAALLYVRSGIKRPYQDTGLGNRDSE